jgi:hypothetical protein
MLLDLSIPDELIRAQEYFDKLMDNGAKIELKKIPEKRTVKQNSYLHALFCLFGGEIGLTTEESKILVKRELGYVYEKNGIKFLSHTSDMDTEELGEFIDKFRNYSSQNGFYLPSADEFNENYFDMMKRVEYFEATQKRYGSV